MRQLLTQVAYTLPFSFNENPFPRGMGRCSRNFFQADLTGCYWWITSSTCIQHIINNRIPQNLSTFSSDTPLPISRCKSVLRPSVIGLSTLQHLQMNDWLVLLTFPLKTGSRILIFQSPGILTWATVKLHRDVNHSPLQSSSAINIFDTVPVGPAVRERHSGKRVSYQGERWYYDRFQRIKQICRFHWMSEIAFQLQGGRGGGLCFHFSASVALPPDPRYKLALSRSPWW